MEDKTRKRGKQLHEPYEITEAEPQSGTEEPEGVTTGELEDRQLETVTGGVSDGPVSVAVESDQF